MATVAIYSANSTTEAHLLKGLLAKHGVESEVTGHYLQGAFGELPVTNMIQLIVAKDNEHRAKDVIERYERGEFEIPDEDAENDENGKQEEQDGSDEF